MAARDHPQFLGSGAADIDQAATGEGSAIIDADNNAAAIRGIGDAHKAAEGQGAMRGGHLAIVEPLATGGAATMELGGVIGGAAPADDDFLRRRGRGLLDGGGGGGDFDGGLHRHQLDHGGAGGGVDPASRRVRRSGGRSAERGKADQAGYRQCWQAPVGEAAGTEAMYAIFPPHGGADTGGSAGMANQVSISSPRGFSRGTSCTRFAMKR